MMIVMNASRRPASSRRRVKSIVGDDMAGKSRVTFLAHAAFLAIVVLLWAVTLSAYLVDRVVLPR